MVTHDYRGKSDLYGRWKTQGNMRLANPNYSKRSKGVSRIWEFLLTVYSSLFKYCETAQRFNEENQSFNWTAKCQQAFEELKRRFTEEPVLIMPDQTKPFQNECDASKYALGAVLTQNDGNGNRHPCAVISKTFSETERNYEIYDRELYELLRNGGTIFKARLILH